MLQLSVKNLLRSKTRTVLTMLGIIIGVAAIISLVGISDGIRSDAEGTLGGINALIIMEEGVFDESLSYIDKSLANRISNVRGVKDTMLEISFFPESFDNQVTSSESFLGESVVVLAMGVEPGKIDTFRNSMYVFDVVEGRHLRSGDSNSMVVSRNIADDFDLFIGSSVEMSGEYWRVVGIVDSPSMMSSFGAGQVLIPITRAWELSDYETSEISSIYVLADDLSDISTLSERLELTFQDYRVYNMQEGLGEISSFLGNLTVALWFVSGIAGVVGGIGVMNTMLMSVMERIKEFGVLKAVGWRNNDIIFMVLGEAAIIGFVAGIIGVVLGYFGSMLVESLSGITTIVSPLLVFQVMFFAVSVGLASAVYPAFIAGRMDPIEAVTYE